MPINAEIDIEATDMRVNSQFIIEIASSLFIFNNDSMLTLFIEKHNVHLYPPRNCRDPAMPPLWRPPSMPMREAADDPPIAFVGKSINHMAIIFLSCNIGKDNNPNADQASLE